MILNCRNNPMRKTVDKAEHRCGVAGDWHCCKENEGDLTRTYLHAFIQVRVSDVLSLFARNLVGA